MTQWGRRRVGAGRKRVVGRRRRVAHCKRARFARLTPVHVTVGVIEGLPTLRSLRSARALKIAFLAGRERGDFRLVHFSVMSNHLHFVVEAESSRALSRGMQGLLVRIARHLNSALNRRGRVFADRFHSRVIGSTLDVRNTLRYVLDNARHHGIAPGHGLDPYSTAAWFDGGRDRAPCSRSPPVAAPRSWQLKAGWRLHGTIFTFTNPAARSPKPDSQLPFLL